MYSKIGEIYMQTVAVSKELDLAIESIEKLLNEKDGEFILEAVKNYKQNKSLDFYTLQELKHRLSK